MKIISGKLTSKPKIIAFDFDGVIVDNESELIYKQYGLQAFHDYEKDKQDEPHNKGRLANYFKLCMQDESIKVFIVTARNIITKNRVQNSLNNMGIDKADIIYMNGGKKSEKLKEIRADVFFDDQLCHLTTKVNNCLMVQVL